MDAEDIKGKANSLFASLFPNIQCEEPYLEGQILFVPFTWSICSIGLMVFESGSLDAFRCRPFQFENSGTVDWIKMKYLTKERAIIQMEAFLRPLMASMIKPQGEGRPRT